jgi:hypothetical protein
MARNHNLGLGAIEFLSVPPVTYVVKRDVQRFTTGARRSRSTPAENAAAALT